MTQKDALKVIRAAASGADVSQDDLEMAADVFSTTIALCGAIKEIAFEKIDDQRLNNGEYVKSLFAQPIRDLFNHAGLSW